MAPNTHILIYCVFCMPKNRTGKTVYFPSSWAKFPTSRVDFPPVWDGFPYDILSLHITKFPGKELPVLPVFSRLAEE